MRVSTPSANATIRGKSSDVVHQTVTTRAALPRDLGPRPRQPVHGRLVRADPCAHASFRGGARWESAPSGWVSWKAWPKPRRASSRFSRGRFPTAGASAKPLALLGYGMAALSKPLFPLAGSAATVFAARFIDRIGKGIRGAPRDALVADYTTRRTTRRGLRPASVARYRGRLCRAAARDRSHAAFRE